MEAWDSDESKIRCMMAPREVTAPKHATRNLPNSWGCRVKGRNPTGSHNASKYLSPNKVVITDPLTQDITKAASSFPVELVRLCSSLLYLWKPYQCFFKHEFYVSFKMLLLSAVGGTSYSCLHDLLAVTCPTQNSTWNINKVKYLQQRREVVLPFVKRRMWQICAEGSHFMISVGHSVMTPLGVIKISFSYNQVRSIYVEINVVY